MFENQHGQLTNIVTTNNKHDKIRLDRYPKCTTQTKTCSTTLEGHSELDHNNV